MNLRNSTFGLVGLLALSAHGCGGGNSNPVQRTTYTVHILDDGYPNHDGGLSASGVSGTVVSGNIIFPTSRAFAWLSLSSKKMDLSPPGWIYSFTNGISNGAIVGWGAFGNPLAQRALFWHDANSSAVDLSPTNFSVSEAFGVGGNQQCGVGWNNSISETHALLWSGNAASVVDLHPIGYNSSSATCTDGTQQGGVVVDANQKRHAAL